MQKNINSPFFFTWFLILDKTQAGGQDGNLVLRCRRNPAVPPPAKYTPLCGEDQRLSTKGKILLKHCNISKTKGGVSINPPPLYQGGGLCVYLKVKQWPNGCRQADNDRAKFYGILQMLESLCVQSNGAKNQNFVFWLNCDSAKNFKQRTLEYLTTVCIVCNNIVPIMLCLIILKLSCSIIPSKSYKQLHYP